MSVGTKARIARGSYTVKLATWEFFEVRRWRCGDESGGKILVDDYRPPGADLNPVADGLYYISWNDANKPRMWIRIFTVM